MPSELYDGSNVEQLNPIGDRDWDGFAGAEPWANGDQPVLHEVNEFLLVGDRNGFHCFGGAEMQFEYTLDLAFPTQAGALAFLNGLPDTFGPADYGFEPQQ